MSASAAGDSASVELEEGGDSTAFLAGSGRSHDVSGGAAPDELQQSEAAAGAGSKGAARWRLVAAWSCFCWGVRMSNFVIPLLLVDAFPKDLAPAAAYVIITDLAVLIFNPYIGRTIDAGERRSTLKRAIVLDFAAILGCISSLYVITLSKDGYFGGASAAALWASVVTFVACAALSAVYTVMAKISYSKDWAVVVASATAASSSAQDKQASQTDLNALMQRIDLINDIIIPVAFGAIISETTNYNGLPPDTIGFVATAATKIVFFPLQLVLLAGMPSQVPELLVPKVPKAIAAAASAQKGFKASVCTRAPAPKPLKAAPSLPPPSSPSSFRTQPLPPSCCLRGEIKSTLGAPRFCSAFLRALLTVRAGACTCSSRCSCCPAATCSCTVTVRPPALRALQ